MKNTFTLNRFILLINRQWNENRKLFLMGVGVFAGLQILYNSVSVRWGYAKLNDYEVLAAFLLELFLGGAIFVSYILKDFSEKNNIANFLNIPATHFEKLMSAIFFGIIIFPLVFLTVYFIIDYSFVIYLNINHMTLLDHNVFMINNWRENAPFFSQILSKSKEYILLIVGFWLFSQTLFIVGSITFRRIPFLKTALCGFVLLFILITINTLFKNLLLSDLLSKLSSNGINEGQVININGKKINDLYMAVIKLLLIFIFPVVLLILAYFKLKEKEV